MAWYAFDVEMEKIKGHKIHEGLPPPNLPEMGPLSTPTQDYLLYWNVIIPGPLSLQDGSGRINEAWKVIHDEER